MLYERVCVDTVFGYTDYRKFLKDWHSSAKKDNPRVTYRYLAREVGFKSAGHFTLILNAKANISISLAERFGAFLRLKKRELEYFKTLVLYNQAKTHADKKRYFERLLSFKECPVKMVGPEQYEFYDKWYYTAIREILSFYPFRGDYAKLGKMVQPTVSADEAEKAVKLLLKLGLIQKRPDGGLSPTDAVISSGYEAQSVAINNFVINSLDLAKEALDRFPKGERNLSWATLNISEEKYSAIQEELRAFRRKILEIARADEKPARVYQFNFQVFPLSKTLEKGEKQ